jgi:MSHA pilin protein MshD
MPTSRRSDGFSLIELVMLIVIVSIGMAGILLVYSTASRSSSDPLVYKQCLAVAEGMLEEIRLNSYAALPGAGWPNPVRADYDDVADYNNYSSTGIRDIQDVAVPGLGSYNVASVTVGAAGVLNGAPARLITVVVTGPAGANISLSGYKVSYP